MRSGRVSSPRPRIGVPFEPWGLGKRPAFPHFQTSGSKAPPLFNPAGTRERETEGISGHDCGFDQRCARRSAYRIRVQSVRFNLHAQNRWAPLPSASEYWAEVFRAGEKAALASRVTPGPAFRFWPALTGRQDAISSVEPREGHACFRSRYEACYS